MSSANIALAKAQFQYLDTSPDCNIPKTYLKELEKHLAAYPGEDHFTIKRQQKKGFGILTCLEDGCQVEIALTRNENERDGGKRIGVGSLSAFQDHIKTHPTHKRSGFRRRAREQRMASSSDSRDNDVAMSGPSAPEPQAMALAPRKRPSDVAFFEPLPDMKVEDDLVPSPPKKLRNDAAIVAPPRAPLAPNMNAVNNGRTLPTVPSNANVDDANEQLREVLAQISHDEPILERALRKKNKTKAEFTKIATQKAHLEQLYGQRDALKEKIRNASFVPPPVPQAPPMMLGTFGLGGQPAYARNAPLPVVKAEPTTHRLPPPPAPQLAQRPMAGLPVKTEVKPQLPPVQWYPQAVQPPLAFHHPPYLPATKQEPEPARFGAYHAHVPAAGAVVPDVKPNVARAPVKREFVNAVASGSGTSSGSASSSSGVREGVKLEAKVEKKEGFPFGLPRYGPAEASDSEDDRDADGVHRHLFEDEASAALARELLRNAGMDVPPPMEDARDDDGLFYGRDRDLYVGPQASADDIDKFLVDAGNSEHFDQDLTVQKAITKLGLKNQQELIPGMEVTLLDHQLIGVSWMVDREAHVNTKGGCLADDMGLGKTVQTIALMVKNRSKDPTNRINLIIAPLALLDQWQFEIQTRSNANFKVLIYHGQNRPKKISALQEYDVVLTTYQTVSREWPDYETEEKKRKAKLKLKKKQQLDGFIVDDSDDDGPSYHEKVRGRKQEAGLLFQMEFYRIILDEAQNIRNRRTRTSRAVNELMGTFRWCLTGTPIINTLTDTYGYIRFLKIRPWYDWTDFNKHIALHEKKNPSLAVSRLQAILATFQMRRTKNSKLNGKALVPLPEKKINVTQLEFSQEEAEIYKMVEARSQATFNRYLRDGTVLKNYHHVLTLLLRLRQICSHPCLIQEEANAFVPAEEVDHTKAAVASELTRAARLVSTEFVELMKKKMKECMELRMEAEKNSDEAAPEGDECPICFDIMDGNAVITACGHGFCKECILDVLHNPCVDDDANRQKDERPCPVCRAFVRQTHLFKRSAFEPTDKELNPNTVDVDDEEASNSESEVEASSRKGKGRAVKRTRGAYRGMDEDDYEDSDDDMSDFIVEDDEDEEEKDQRRADKQRARLAKGKRRVNVVLDSDEEIDEPEIQEVLLGSKSKKQLEAEALEKMPRFLPSTKMKYMMELIVKMFKERPDEKILVISQWTSCLSLVSDYLTEKGILHVMYQGSMSRDKRDTVVRAFMSKEKAKVMLMSLKCGGVGLNLTRANNVISLDLAWSRAVESQAWDRLHRLGQQRTVDVQRLVISGTVEDRIMALQDRKQLLADGSLGEGKGKKIGRLTVAQLADLFGVSYRGRRLTD